MHGADIYAGWVVAMRFGSAWTQSPAPLLSREAMARSGVELGSQDFVINSQRLMTAAAPLRQRGTSNSSVSSLPFALCSTAESFIVNYPAECFHVACLNKMGGDHRD